MVCNTVCSANMNNMQDTKYVQLVIVTRDILQKIAGNLKILVIIKTDFSCM